MRQYKVVQASEIETLTQQVQELLDENWDLQGGVASFVTHDGREWLNTLFIQALYREVE